MGGISDWAVDLQRMLKPGDSGNGGGGGNESIVAMGAIEPTIEGCTNDKMKNEVLTAWRETTGLTGLQYSWFPGGRWQKAMDLYMGEGSRKDNVQGSWGDPGPVGVHIVLNYYAHNAKWIEWPHQHYAWIYCTPEAKPGGSKDDKGCDNARAYTWDSLGTFWSAHCKSAFPQFPGILFMLIWFASSTDFGHRADTYNPFRRSAVPALVGRGQNGLS
jgi:hypothetical protein